MRHLIAAVIAGLMTACSSAGQPVATFAASSPTPSVAAASVAPTVSPTVSAVAASPTLESLLRPLVASWNPAGPAHALIVERPEGEDMTLIAVPLAGGPAVPLVTIHNQGFQLGYQVRNDGGALAVSIPTTAGTARIAIWDLRSGARRWLTDEESGVYHSTPVWSGDGSWIYFAAQSYAQTGVTDHGIFRIRTDGTDKMRVRGPEQNGATLAGFTPDFGGLVWSRIRAGGAVEVLDLGSGRNRSFDEMTDASVASWRDSQPRALVIVGGCCAGRPGGSLALWDDAAGSSRLLMGVQSTPPVAVTAAAWDPGGQRFAAVVLDRRSDTLFGSIFIYDAAGRQLASVAGTDRAQQLLWPQPGIVFTRAPSTAGPGAEIVLVQATGGLPLVLYRDAQSVFIHRIAGP